MNTPAEAQRLSAQISGRVQGVGFRYFTRTTAQQLGVVGWVRNEPDGTVRLEAEGRQEALNTLLDAVHDGPPSARVEEVDVTWDAAQGEFEHFEVAYT